MRICDRCQKPIDALDAYHEIIPESMSAARPTSYVHKRRCLRDTTQPALEPPVMPTPQDPRSRPRSRPRR